MRTSLSWKTGIAVAASVALTGVSPVGACSWQKQAAASGGVRMAQAEPARPARGPQSELSVQSPAPPASTSQPTASTDQPPKVKEMNAAEEKKVEKEGK
ncbi:MAG: hypothetical protein NVSMB26_01170 [Beijerinckiaceae bacterium]